MKRTVALAVRLVTVPYRLLYPAILVFCGRRDEAFQES
jgi:TctA family transporter